MIAGVETCALCPRLCRHVCPVASGTALESATPTAIMGLILDADKNNTLAASAIDLCTRCGACEEHCGVEQPVQHILASARTQLHGAAPTWSPPAIKGHHQTVAVICTANDWSSDLEAVTGQPLAVVHTPDHLGEPLRIRSDTAGSCLELIAEHFHGRTAIAGCHTCREALEQADIPVETLDSLIPVRPAIPTWRSCRCTSAPGVNTLLRCCGARGPLSSSHPELTRAMGAELAGRLDGQSVYVPDARCAEHLKQSGASAVGPDDLLPTPRKQNK